MAFTPPKKLRELILKASKGELTEEEKEQYNELINSSDRAITHSSTMSDFNPAAGIAWGFICNHLF